MREVKTSELPKRGINIHTVAAVDPMKHFRETGIRCPSLQATISEQKCLMLREERPSCKRCPHSGTAIERIVEPDVQTKPLPSPAPIRPVLAPARPAPAPSPKPAKVVQTCSVSGCEEPALPRQQLCRICLADGEKAPEVVEQPKPARTCAICGRSGLTMPTVDRCSRCYTRERKGQPPVTDKPSLRAAAKPPLKNVIRIGTCPTCGHADVKMATKEKCWSCYDKTRTRGARKERIGTCPTCKRPDLWLVTSDKCGRCYDRIKRGYDPIAGPPLKVPKIAGGGAGSMPIREPSPRNVDLVEPDRRARAARRAELYRRCLQLCREVL